jgi:hypothetical protein
MNRVVGSVKGWIIAAFVLGASGCVEYTIETALQADGGGFRKETMEVTRNEDFDLSEGAFRGLMAVGEDTGWTSSFEVDSKGDTTLVFQRQTQIEGLGAWPDLNDEVHLTASSPADASRKVGNVTLGNVRFRNRVEVDTGTVRGGARSFTYRETFYWDEAVDVMVEMFMTLFSDAVDELYPRLSPRQRGEIVGIARANLWTAFDEGLLEEWEDRILYKARDRTTEQAMGIVRTVYPDANDFFLRNTLHQLYNGEASYQEKVEGILENELKGLNLALNIGMQIRLNMPGTVVNSNHHETDGSILIWEFGPLDAAVGPIEIFAESVGG